MTSPLVTILISVHNGATTLDRSLESIQKQTTQDFLVLAIDDCSSDTTSVILRRWQEIFGSDRFHIITNEKNLGLTRSLIRGLTLITTRYTARNDADDWWHPEKLEQQIQFLEANPDYGVLGTAYTNITHGKEHLVIPPLTDTDIRHDMLRRNPFAHSTVLFRTELIRKAGGYNPTIRYGQDYELWLRISPSTRLANLKKNLCYRSSDSGLSYQHQDAQMWQYLRTQFRYIRLLRRPFLDYRYLVVPLLTILTPDWLRQLKRRFL